MATLAISGCGNRRPAVSQSIDDATTSTRVKTALLNEPDIAVTKIDVDTSQGVVTLTGTVRSKEEEERAIATARRVSGVRISHGMLNFSAGIPG